VQAIAWCGSGSALYAVKKNHEFGSNLLRGCCEGAQQAVLHFFLPSPPSFSIFPGESEI